MSFKSQPLFHIITFLIMYLVLFPPVIHALSVNEMVDKYPNISTITTSSDLIAKIQKNINNLLTANTHRNYPSVMLCEDLNKLLWFKGTEIRALSETLPYATESQKNSLKLYLQYEISNYLFDNSYRLFENPDYSVGYVSYLNEKIPSARFAYGNIIGQHAAPNWEYLYALWTYGHYSNDWTFLSNNWNTITTIYNKGVNDTKKVIAGGIGEGYTTILYAYAPNSEIAGRIGYARIAKKIGRTTEYNSAVTSLTNRISILGTHVSTGISSNQFCNWDSTNCGRDNQLNLPQFDFLTPEIGKYYKESYFNQVQSTIQSAETQLPWWFMGSLNLAKSGGEGYFMSPALANQIFQAKSNILDTSVSELRIKIPWKNEFATVPSHSDAFYYLNLIALIRKSESVIWTDTNTPPSTLSVNLTPAPIIITGDMNGDGLVNIYDFSNLLLQYGKTNTSNNLPGDFNQTGTVDFADLLIQLKHLYR